MAKKKTTKNTTKKSTPSVSSSDAKKLSGILKSVGVNVSASKIQSVVSKSGSSSSSSSNSSSSSSKTPTMADVERAIGAPAGSLTAAASKLSSGGGNSTPVNNTSSPFNVMDYVTPGREAEAQRIISGGNNNAPTPGTGMSQSQFIDYLVNQGIVTDRAGAYKVAGLTDPNAPLPPEIPIDPNNPIMQNLPPGWENFSDIQKAIYNAGATSIYEAKLAGKELNPNVELSPEVLRKFIEDATAQLDPYYKEKFALEKNKFETSISQMMSDYNKNLGRLDTSFKQKLGSQAESEAASGTAFSSGRKQRQERTIDLQNQDIQDYTTGIQRTGQELATEYEKQFGSSGLRTLNIPGLADYKATTAGVTPTATSRSLYTPLGNIAIGEQNKARELAIKNEADALEQSYRGNRSLTNLY